MFRKEEEALRHWSPENVRMCAERQMEILEEAAVMLRPGGILVYSTCTFAPEENEGVIGAFLSAHPEYSVRRISEMQGVDMKGWGFEPGHPEWAQMQADGNPADTGSEDAGRDNRESQADGLKRVPEGLEGTVRLWPHRLDGEGHFPDRLRGG